MSTTGKARIYGASDDLIEFDGAIYGEAGWYSDRPAKITLKAPDIVAVSEGRSPDAA